MESLKPLFEPLERLLAKGGTRKDIAFIIVSAAALVASFAAPGALPVDLAWVAVLLCGVPIVVEAFIALVCEFDVKADVLVSIALIAALAVGQYFAAGEVAVIMQLGALLEELTVARAQRGIRRLVELTPRAARVVGAGGAEREIEANDVQIGEVVRVLPGETVPVDGVVEHGVTSIDESAVTGEPMPKDKQAGDEVSSGTVNQFGAIDVRATRAGQDSSIQRMAQLVQSADAGKAKVVRLADRWATWVVIGALASAVAIYLVTGEILRAVTVLVVFCPCSLVLATPTAIVAAIGNATKHGFLVKEGDALERLSRVSRVVFDKTGTLTEGVPRVSALLPCEGGALDDSELYELVASAELRSEHPLGKAIVRGAREEGVKLREPETFDMLPGRGVVARVDGKQVVVGNEAMLVELGISMEPQAACRAAGVWADCDAAANIGTAQVDASNKVTVSDLEVLLEAQGSPGVSAAQLGVDAAACFSGRRVVAGSAASTARQRIPGLACHLDAGDTIAYVAVGGALAGAVALADTIRREARRTVRRMREAGAQPVLLTGDNEPAACAVASAVGLDDVLARCRPEDKMRYIEQSEAGGVPCAMVGDGINDAPALKRAFVGIAVGGVGSDIAVEAADIAIVNDNIAELPHLLALSRHMMRVIKANLTISMTLNFVAIVLAFLAVLDPVTGALVHNCGSVFVIVNSALLLRWTAKTLS